MSAGMKRRRNDDDDVDMDEADGSARSAPPKRKQWNGAAGPHGKKPKTAKYQPKKFAFNTTKARIRDLRRQLSRKAEDMPANLRLNKERELAACEHELRIAEGESLKQQMIPKYHKIRFFERQKATRFLKKAVKKLNDNDDPEKHAELEREKHVAEVDLNYTLYYPLIRPYVSLYASTKSKDGEQEGSATKRIGGDQNMWEIVEQKMEENALDNLRNGLEWREGADSAPSTAPTIKTEGKAKSAKASTSKGEGKPPTAKKSAAKPEKEESGDESDGGFFE